MKITILNGSPRKENTAAMVDAFAEGAKAAGDENKSEEKLAAIRDFAKSL